MKFKRDDNSRLTEVTDTLGRKISYNYNSDGRLTGVKDFADRTIKFEYDGNGDLVSVTSPSVTGTTNGNDFLMARPLNIPIHQGLMMKR